MNDYLSGVRIIGDLAASTNPSGLSLEQADTRGREHFSYEQAQLDNLTPKRVPLTKANKQSLRNWFEGHQTEYQDHDAVFQKLTPRWIKLLKDGKVAAAGRLWDQSLDIATQWEASHQAEDPKPRIHKGSAYYFWGVTCILGGDLEKGFHLVHQAYEEDKLTFGVPPAATKPAYSLVTLDYQQQAQYFKERVEEIANLLDEQLARYRSRTKMSLTLGEFRTKFARNSSLIDQAFFFVFVEFGLFKLKKEIRPGIRRNTFASLLGARHLFDLCLIVDGVLQDPYKKAQLAQNPNAEVKGITFGNLVKFALGKISASIASYVVGKNKYMQDNLASALRGLTTTNPVDGSSTLDGQALKPLEADFAAAYCLRNFAGHNIDDERAIYELFDQLAERVLSCLFYSVETFYC